MLKITGFNPNVSPAFKSRLTFENKTIGFKREIDSKKNFHDKEVLESLNKYLEENSDNLSIIQNNQILLHSKESLSFPSYLSSFDNGIEIMHIIEDLRGNHVRLTYTKSNINGELVPELNNILNKMDVILKKEKIKPKEAQSVQEQMSSFVKATRALLPNLNK
jgi:hypothetical protein